MASYNVESVVLVYIRCVDKKLHRYLMFESIDKATLYAKRTAKDCELTMQGHKALDVPMTYVIRAYTLKSKQKLKIPHFEVSESFFEKKQVFHGNSKV